MATLSALAARPPRRTALRQSPLDLNAVRETTPAARTRNKP
jgi:hypothetical protein